MPLVPVWRKQESELVEARKQRKIAKRQRIEERQRQRLANELKNAQYQVGPMHRQIGIAEAPRQRT